MFDNGVLRLTVEKNRLYTGAIAGAVGAMVGGLLVAMFGRRKTTA
jgi:hypothetical protein